ncbi:linear amide C-N hydrolase [Gordonia sp. NB41Y]|uniref:linear amide C-N hydrolase n=1 Tax=Gordonia sp. NB41Y TaxID=875808 RepID=UPI0006B1A436|nr:linear amide C-N hydrolase [Gordonia sp. NB41Y]EMP13862.2 choloylglycine hydrolase [Gordonia sp. NB41Y]WLP89103.1 linear amide C-N hydrolase [Gordonia sp. NB41Y]
MCTRVMWPDANGSVIVGRNMDFHQDLHTNLWKLPRGIKRDDRISGKLEWTAKYGSVIAGVYDILSTDGINERGLGAHLLWLAESDYGTPDDSRPQLAMSIWLQYYLDNFETVAEAVAWTEEHQPQVVPMADPTGHSKPALHLAIEDASGDSAIIEYIDGKLDIYHSRDHLVMTNSPTYDKQLELVKKYKGLGGDDPLPGTCLASDRFARAQYYVGVQPQPTSQVQAMAAMLSIIRNCAQPFRNPEPGKPDASQTLWQVVLDLTNLRYAFESTTRPNTVWVDLKDLDFSEGSGEAKLDLLSKLALEGGIAGEVHKHFKGHHKFHIVSIEQAKLIGEVVAKAAKVIGAAKTTAEEHENKIQDEVQAKLTSFVAAE